MTYHWHEFLELATTLADHNSECHRRCAISRAYYAVFHAGRRKWAEEQGHLSTRTVEHAALWDYFRQRAASRHLGEEGRRLLLLRRRADYDASCDCSAKDTEHALRRARELLGALAA
jgi:uncharacterized protein (UPF0332 family)